MSLESKASDWQVFARFNISGGAGISAGLYTFDFYSATSGVSALFSFSGVGVGAGADAKQGGGNDLSGLGFTEDVPPLTAWNSIECTAPFSAYDLDGAWGRVTMLGGGIGIGYFLVFITAAPAFWSLKNFFKSQYVGGLGSGSVGAGGQVLIGGWKFKKVSNNKPASEAWA